MSRATRRILLIVGAAVGLLVLVAVAAPRFMHVDRYIPRLEAAASDRLGMEVRIGGRLGLGLFPGLHVTVDDGRILDEQGAVVASAKRVVLWIELLPLLRGESRLRRLEVTRPRLSIERDLGGRLNVERLRKAAALLGALDGASVSLTDGNLAYVDRRSGERLEASGVDLAVSRIRLPGGRGPQLVQGSSLTAELACREIRRKALSLTALKVSVDGRHGVFRMEPLTMRLFGGQVAGSLRADLSGPVPLYQIRCSLPRFRIEEFLRTLSAKKSAHGAMDFSASLSMRGASWSELVRALAGRVSLRGEDLTLEGDDLDRSLSRFESSQNFNLVDLGAVFFAGPLGLAITKGNDFVSAFQGAGGSSRIRTVVSDWSVEQGVAQAMDVALATSKNRIALHGRLDLVNERFADMTMAVVDPGGCARVRQAIHGAFARPIVEKPRVLTSLAGPVLRLVRQTRGLFPARPCEPFYSGSVAPPG